MVAATLGETRTTRGSFYVWMAGIFCLIAFGGFVPTYWAKVAAGSFTGNPVLHLHGMVFFGWTLLYLTQTLLVANRRTALHRSLGVLGVAFATAMAFTVVLAAINSIKVADAAGVGDAARRFSVVSLTSLVLFEGLFIAAIVNVKRPEIHKRLMLLTMIPLAQAASARIFMTLAHAPPGPPPVFVAIPPGVLMCLLGVAAMVYDWRTRGRTHAVYLWGLPLVLAQVLLTVPLGGSDAWMGVARAVESLAG